MYITCTCGHQVDNIDDMVDAALKGYTREDERCIDFVTLCKDCYTMYKLSDEVLYSIKEQNKWLEVT